MGTHDLFWADIEEGSCNGCCNVDIIVCTENVSCYVMGARMPLYWLHCGRNKIAYTETKTSEILPIMYSYYRFQRTIFTSQTAVNNLHGLHILLYANTMTIKAFHFSMCWETSLFEQLWLCNLVRPKFNQWHRSLQGFVDRSVNHFTMQCTGNSNCILREARL